MTTLHSTYPVWGLSVIGDDLNYLRGQVGHVQMLPTLHTVLSIMDPGVLGISERIAMAVPWDGWTWCLRIGPVWLAGSDSPAVILDLWIHYAWALPEPGPMAQWSQASCLVSEVSVAHRPTVIG